jgi:hypothetical protein
MADLAEEMAKSKSGNRSKIPDGIRSWKGWRSNVTAVRCELATFKSQGVAFSG